MVQRHNKMEEDDDLEALRIAALQTIRTRKNTRRPTASITAHRQLENQPFCRHVSNPNLIAIVPTESKVESRASEVIQLTNGIVKNSKETSLSPLKTPRTKEVGESRIEKVQEKEKDKTLFRKVSQTDKEVGKEETVNTTKTSPVSDKSESDKIVDNIKFDEDELDFEGDTVMLHDDDDSLDRLMDEMEQEFNQGTLPVSESGKGKTKLTKTTQKLSCPTSSKSDIQKCSSSSNAKDHTSVAQQSSKTRSQSPNDDSPIYYSPCSPSYTPFKSDVGRVSASSKYNRARSPYSTKFNGRKTSESDTQKCSSSSNSKDQLSVVQQSNKTRSQSPNDGDSPNYSSCFPSYTLFKSDVGGRVSASTKYNRSRSPYSTKYNGRRTSESPKRWNSSSSPSRRHPTRNGSPPRKKFSPTSTVSKRRSLSPVSVRRRRSPRRSSNRMTSSIQPDSRHRWKSPPHHRKTNLQHKRDLSSRKVARQSSPNPKIVDENKQSKIEKKFSTNRVQVENAEKSQKNEPTDLQEPLDPKFEARRRKFESSVFITPANKKICLKTSDENQLKRIGKKKEESEKIVQNYHSNEDDDDNEEDEVDEDEDEVEDIQLSKTNSSKILNEPVGKKSYSQEITTGRRVTEMKSGSSPQSSINTKKKTIILDESGQPQSVRLDISTIPENRVKSKVSHSFMKLQEHKEISRSPKMEKIQIRVENELNEETESSGSESEEEEEVIVKKIIKKKRKNKDLKRKRELIVDSNVKKIKKKFKEVKCDEEVFIDDDEEEDEDGENDKVEEVSPKQTSTTNKPGLDLRAELSRRRAERLKGVTNPMARIIQSAFEDVVANRKKFESRCTVQERDLGAPTPSAFKTKGNRRVHVLAESSSNKPTSTQYRGNESSDESSGQDNFSSDSSNRKYGISTSNQRSATSLRSTITGTGRSILRRSQV